MFKVIYRRWYDEPQHAAHIAGPFPTLIQAFEARFLSGDLVVDMEDKVVPNTFWLFPWERCLLICYAKRAIMHDNPGVKVSK